MAASSVDPSSLAEFLVEDGGVPWLTVGQLPGALDRSAQQQHPDDRAQALTVQRPRAAGAPWAEWITWRRVVEVAAFGLPLSALAAVAVVAFAGAFDLGGGELQGGVGCANSDMASELPVRSTMTR